MSINTPKRGHKGPNGVWSPRNAEEQNPNSPIGHGKKGFDAGNGIRYWEQKYKPKFTLEQAEKVFEKELKLKKDWAAELATTCFVANQDRIFEAFSRGLLKGDPKVWTALANRAFGLPKQEVSFGQTEAFTVVVKHVGQPAQPTTITVSAAEVTTPSVPVDHNSPEFMAQLRERLRMKRLAEKTAEEETTPSKEETKVTPPDE